MRSTVVEIVASIGALLVVFGMIGLALLAACTPVLVVGTALYLWVK